MFLQTKCREKNSNPGKKKIEGQRKREMLYMQAEEILKENHSMG